MPDVPTDDPLASFAPRERKRLARDMREHRVAAGETLIDEGEGGIAFFVILEGEATVTIGDREVRRLRAGDHAGEIALLDEGARTATITAAGDVRCLALTTWNFRPFVRENPDVAWALLLELAGRVREAELRARG
jgi:CRP-like cAMP-binding protein